MFRYVLLLVLVGITLRGDGTHRHAPAEPAGDAAAKMFDRLKSLAGEWEYAGDGELKGKIAASFRVTAGGSAVVEVIFPGSDMEMVSVYYRDGKDLVMTHYCMVGNQPRMRATGGEDPSRLVFEFLGGSNLDPDKDPHIHAGVIHLIDNDHVRSEWDFYGGGKLLEKHRFDLVRRR